MNNKIDITTNQLSCRIDLWDFTVTAFATLFRRDHFGQLLRILGTLVIVEN